MSRRAFVDPMNKQPKIFNLSYGSIIGGLIFSILAGVGGGLVLGMFAGAIGFSGGGWVSKKMHTGELQGVCYKSLPFASVWINQHIPDSSSKYEL